MRSYGHALGPALVLIVLLCSTAAWSVTPACPAGPGVKPFQVDRRTATRLLLSQARPSYPPLARINYIHGDVSLLLTVDCAGRVEEVHVVRGHPFLAVAALQAIKKWIYHPFVTRAGPAEFQTMVNVNFALLSRDFKQLPPQPEKFLARWVRPPQPPAGVKDASDGKDTVRIRVLVNAKGRVVDSTQLSGTATQFEAAERVVSLWKFKPAHWGTLSVPWYMDVGVAVEDARQHTAGTALGPSRAAAR
ncbi:MAG: TonB family protein [Terriglobia bacterium]